MNIISIIFLLLLAPVFVCLILLLIFGLVEIMFKVTIFVIPKITKLISWLIIVLILVGIFLPVILIIF